MHSEAAKPRYSLTKYQKLLEFRGVWRKPNGTTIESPYSSSSDEEEQYYMPSFETSAHSLRALITENSDLFYSTFSYGISADVFDDFISLDHGYTYVSANGTAGDRRYSNNSERVLAGNTSILRSVEEESRKAYHVWEQHDDMTRSEISVATNGDCAIADEDDSTNGGIYDPYREELSTLNSLNSSQLLIAPPASKFRDSLALNFKKRQNLEKVDHLRKYKNNLMGILRSKNNLDLMLIASLSEIVIYEFDPITNCPNQNPSLKFETRPLTTSMHDRVISTYPYFPHTINFMKTSKDWVEGSVVGVCSDDGSVYIWHGEKFEEHITKNKLKPSNSLYGLKISPDIVCKLNSSAWGLDFGKAKDSNGTLHHVFATSANSKTATLFYVADSGQGTLFSQETQETLHNIPEVCIVDYTISPKSHVVHLSCSTIYGEVLIIRFDFTVDFEDGSSVSAKFEAPEIVRRTCLKTPCWTAKSVHTRYFKSVQSIRAMVGDPSIDEDCEAGKVLLESKIVDLHEDPIVSSDFGGSASWQYFETPVVDLASPEDTQQLNSTYNKLQTFQEENRRLHQTYYAKCEGNGTEPQLNCQMIVMSTEDRLGLFRADTLLCSGATKRVFTLNIPKNEETKWCDRISITEIIPELSCYIALTQSGLVSIFRLCQHRGLYGMRQEHLFPNALGVAIGDSTYRTLVGLSCRDLSVSLERPRFDIYLLYSDGLILTYELKENRSELDDF